jgi:23S rRNA pseudouridine1911/1915/1917 synthase
VIHRRLVYDGPGGQRLDRVLTARLDGLTRSQVKRLIEAGLVQVNGKPAKAGSQVRPGDELAVRIPSSPPSHILPEPIPLKVLHEDAWILVVDKPAGLVVHPGAGHPSGTLIHALMAHCPALDSIGGTQRAGLVHRLDKDTSGVMVVAKNEAAHRELTRQFKERLVSKEYLALVHGRVQGPGGDLALPIGRDPKDRKRISVRSRSPRAAVTHWEVVRHLPHCTLLRVRPETGRTHQIRVHLASVRHPVVGDALYGSRARALQTGRADIRRILLAVPRQFLHAERLTLVHPDDGVRRTYSAPLADDLARWLRAAEFDTAAISDLY